MFFVAVGGLEVGDNPVELVPLDVTVDESLLEAPVVTVSTFFSVFDSPGSPL